MRSETKTLISHQTFIETMSAVIVSIKTPSTVESSKTLTTSDEQASPKEKSMVVTPEGVQRLKKQLQQWHQRYLFFYNTVTSCIPYRVLFGEQNSAVFFRYTRQRHTEATLSHPSLDDSTPEILCI